MMRSTTQGAMFVAALTLAPLVIGLLLATAAGTRPLLMGLLARHLEKQMFSTQSGLMKACCTGFFPPEKPFTL
jgi:ABC-type molybdate transport system permease subunit